MHVVGSKACPCLQMCPGVGASGSSPCAPLAAKVVAFSGRLLHRNPQQRLSYAEPTLLKQNAASVEGQSLPHCWVRAKAKLRAPMLLGGHIYTYTHAHTCTHALTCTHAHTHMHTHAHIHSNAHIHTCTGEGCHVVCLHHSA